VLAAVARFDGVYQGQQIPADRQASCRPQPRTVWFQVRGGTVELSSSRHRHKAVSRPMMSGTVAPDGTVAMGRDGTDRMAAGQIAGDRLSVAESVMMPTLLQGGGSCAYRYEATRLRGAGEE